MGNSSVANMISKKRKKIEKQGERENILTFTATKMIGFLICQSLGYTCDTSHLPQSIGKDSK